MAFILTSFLNTHYRDENGIRQPTAIEDTNLILTNIKNNLKSTNKVVLVANDKNDFYDNELKGRAVFGGLKKSGIEFKQKIILDERNKQKAKEICADADLIILTGGKCFRQLKFLNEIDFAGILQNFDGLVIGVSAGSMNLCCEIENFPEDFDDLNDPTWLNGLGVCDDILIPHFDGKTLSYQFDVEVDLISNYVLPASSRRTLVGLDNDAYIVIDNDGNKKYYGNVCHIANGRAIYDIAVECDDVKVEEKLFEESDADIEQNEVYFDDISAETESQPQDFDLNPEELLQDLYKELEVDKPVKRKKVATTKSKVAKGGKADKTAKATKGKKETKKSR